MSMNKRESQKFKKLLEKRRNEIIRDVSHIANDNLRKSQRDASGDLSGYAFHMADVATDNYDREFLLGIADTERAVLVKIDEALKRIKESAYGDCILCKKKIMKKRLVAIPQAEYCKACQEKEESKKTGE